MKQLTKTAVGIVCVGSAITVGVAATLAARRAFAWIEKKAVFNPGNAPCYSLRRVVPDSQSVLRGKHLIFLGSSVTKGACSLNQSFVEYLARRDGFSYTKEAVSGTTLTTIDNTSYIPRLHNIRDAKADVFICQLSTNDVWRQCPLGKVSASFNRNEFDTMTITGAIEHIISYVQERWNCPVVFYTSTDCGSDAYMRMIDVLYVLRDKWDIGIIDLSRELPVESVSTHTMKTYMANPVHPTRRGYFEWWGPQMAADLERMFANAKQ